MSVFFQTVGVGSVAGDGTGDRGQVPFQKVNSVINALNGTVPFTALVNNQAPINVVKNSNYTGGTVGFVNATVVVTANVTNCGNNFEWAFLSVMNNSSATGENVGGYFQGNAVLSTSGPTWGGTVELRDMSGASNPTVSRVGLEVDNRASGPDTNFSRVGLDLVLTRFPEGSGAAATFGYGYRLQCSGDAANVTISNAFSVASCNVAVAFDCSTSTVGSGSLKMAAGVPILFDVSGSAGSTVNKVLSTVGAGLDHQVNNVLVNRLLQTGGLQVGAAQVVGPQLGLGVAAATFVQVDTTTAVSTDSTFDGYTLKQIVRGLRTHGLFV
jgi:hypothetical protein